MRITTARNKLARREGTDLGLKTPGSKAHASLLRKLNILPGQHGTGTRRRRKQSERGKQLREKQKLRYMFGLSEKQLKNYFKKAVAMKGNSALNISQLLERRLDNVVYRLGVAPTRPSARQLVNHRHVKVNGEIVNVASYQVSDGDEVTFASEKSTKIPWVESALANKDLLIPGWLKKEDTKGKFVAEPTSEEIEKQVDLRSVIEFYSR